MMHRQAVQIRAVEQVTDNFATALNVDWAHGEPVAEIVAKHGGAAMYVTDGATAGRVQIPLSKLCVKLIEIRVRVSWKSSDVIPKQGRDCRRQRTRAQQTGMIRAAAQTQLDACRRSFNYKKQSAWTPEESGKALALTLPNVE